jgi:hypothetical protein
MNDKIEHCLYESGLTADGCWNELDDYAKESIERFAVLIVKECADNGVVISKEEYALFQKLTKIWYHTEPDKTGSFFICGEGGKIDEHGLPEMILVCPQMGTNITAVYGKEHVGRSGQ